jgi:predicted esterase
MPRPLVAPFRAFRTLLVVSLAFGPIFAASSARAETFTLAPLPYQPVWCAAELDPLTPDVCHIAGTPAPDGRRTLVIFLHGVIAKNTMWQWLQERAIARSAKLLHFDAIVPQAPRVGPNGAGGFAWPGLRALHGAESDALVEGWTRARRKLEQKNGHPFDEVFVVGFSSGAYFATSLALHEKLHVDGYVVLAGGTTSTPSPNVRPKPVFIGVCANDGASAPQARELGHLLAARGWPTRVDEQAVGHGVSDVHMAHALGWLRAQRPQNAPGRHAESPVVDELGSAATERNP